MTTKGNRPVAWVVGITATACSIFAPLVLQRIRADCGRISLNILEGYSKTLGSWILSGDVDVGLISDLDISHGLRALKVVEEELLLLTPSGAREAGWISIDELIATPLILSDERAEAVLSQPLTVDMKLTSIELIRDLVQSGVGVSILPYSAARDKTLAGALDAFRIGEHGIRRQLAVCTSETRRMSTAARVVVDMLAAISRELVEAGYFTYPPCGAHCSDHAESA